MFHRKQLLMAVVICAAAAGCTTSKPLAYSGIASSAQLRPNPSDRTGRIPLRYKTQVNWNAYRSAIVEPVTIYRGPDAQFAKVGPADQATLARYMQTEFSKALAKRFAPASGPGPGTLRIKLTLTGAETTTPVLGTLSRVDMLGGAYNGIQAIRGGQGSMTGSVTYAVEVFDSASGELLLAYVSKQFPNALNIGASMGTLNASMGGIRKGADALLGELR